jgi:hypothetical protein
VLVQVVGGQLDGQQVSTNASGVFVFPPVTEAGFSLRVKRAGYETVQVPIATLPHHLNASVGLSPLPQQVHEQWIVPWGVSIPQLTFTFPVHHSGKIELGAGICVYGCLESESAFTCTQLRDAQGNLIAQHHGKFSFGVVATIDVMGGHRYNLTVSVCDTLPQFRNILAYYVDVIHPN